MDTNKHEFFARWIDLLAVVGLCLLLAGCPMVDVKEFNFTRDCPDEADLIGRWSPNEETLLFIRNRGKYPEVEHSIELKSDHTIEVQNMPDWWTKGDGKAGGTFESFSGTWKLMERGEWPLQKWVLLVNIPRFGIFLNVYRQGPPYEIFIRVGDPNNGDAMLFERVQPES